MEVCVDKQKKHSDRLRANINRRTDVTFSLLFELQLINRIGLMISLMIEVVVFILPVQAAIDRSQYQFFPFS